jgi:transposase
MAKQILPDELWAVLQPLVPKDPPKPKGGRPRVSDRAALTGILFVLRTGIPWEYLPKEMGCGSGMTCWRRLRDWQEAGVWKKLHRVLLAKLEESEHIDWEKVCIDTSSVPAPGGAKKQARTHATAQNRARSAILWLTPREFH